MEDYSHAEQSAVTWEQFVENFREEYVPLVERERLAQEFLSLKQTTELVIKITKMFTERALYCLEYASSEQVKILWYLIILKTGIREFVSKN